MTANDNAHSVIASTRRRAPFVLRVAAFLAAAAVIALIAFFVAACPATGATASGVEPADGAVVERWWPRDVAWERAESAPVWSTSVEGLQSASPLFTPSSSSK